MDHEKAVVDESIPNSRGDVIDKNDMKKWQLSPIFLVHPSTLNTHNKITTCKEWTIKYFPVAILAESIACHSLQVQRQSTQSKSNLEWITDSRQDLPRMINLCSDKDNQYWNISKQIQRVYRGLRGLSWTDNARPFYVLIFQNCVH